MNELRIWKYIAVVALIGLAGAASVQAQTTNVLTIENITLKGKLIPAGTTVTDESLSGNTNTISVLRLEIINGGVTNHAEVIGQATIASGVTNFMDSLLEVTGFVDETPTATTSDKSLVIFEGSAGTATNAVLLLNITDKIKGSNVTAKVKFQGIWDAGTNTVSGTMSSIK